jgi:hypothetical protein
MAPDPNAPPATPAPVKHKLGTTRFPVVNLPAEAGTPPVEVKEMLRENLAREQAAGLNELAPAPLRRSHRHRDYCWLIASTNLFFGLIALFSWSTSPILFVSALSAMAMVSAGLTWLMWFVMDDY